MLASVAAMQGRIAMWHALGDAVQPLDRNVVSSTVFTDPEIATVGMTQSERRDVIVAIGEDGNKVVAANPDLWVGVAAALCNFVDPSAPVKDVVTGGRR